MNVRLEKSNSGWLWKNKLFLRLQITAKGNRESSLIENQGTLTSQ